MSRDATGKNACAAGGVHSIRERMVWRHLYMANYQFWLSARVFDLLIPLPECAISLFYSFI
jgi:hypothetical protein